MEFSPKMCTMFHTHTPLTDNEYQKPIHLPLPLCENIFTAPSDRFATVQLVGLPRHTLADTHTRLLNVKLYTMDTPTTAADDCVKVLLAGSYVKVLLAGDSCVKVLLAGGSCVKVLLAYDCVKVLLAGGSCVKVLLADGSCVKVLLAGSYVKVLLAGSYVKVLSTGG